jgi:hypothetical protein
MLSEDRGDGAKRVFVVHGKRFSLAAFAATVAVSTVAAFAGSANVAQSSTWYWSPGACKPELQQYGVSIGDGRTFHVQKAFCIGLHNHCWLNAGLRRYKVFITVMRSNDGVVRSMQLTVTGHHTWSGSKLKIVSHSMSGVRERVRQRRVVGGEDREPGRLFRHPPVGHRREASTKNGAT